MNFYESPHKLLKTLEQMKSYFGEDRNISVSRELTKLYEETIRCTISAAIVHFTSHPPKGEFVLIVQGKS
jgi:16S rRNA (cytidine1402-2'-O)-methyltransferase